MAAHTSKSAIEPIGQTVRSLLRQWLTEEELRVYAACGQWERVVGTKLAERSEPLEFRNGVLLVRASSPVWAQELQFLKHEILRRLNTLVGAPIVKDLLFRQGRLRPKESRLLGESRVPCAPERDVAAEPSVQPEWFSRISDPVLAEACGRLLRAYTRRAQAPAGKGGARSSGGGGKP